jgi:hypothetical protein
VKKESSFRNTNEEQDSFNESDEFGTPGLNAPKQSPMRRKEKFRTKDFETEKARKKPKRNYRGSIKHDFDDLDNQNE